MNRILVLCIELVLVSCHIHGFLWKNKCSGEWTIGAIFEENVKLTCSFGDDCNCPSAQKKIKWTGGQQKKLLLYDGVSKYPLKYNESLETDSFSLIIKNFSTEDINVNYACHCGFNSFKKELSLNKDEFEKHPTKQSQHADFSLVNGVASVSINMNDVYPIPTCMAKMNMKNVTFNINTIDGSMFYSANISLHVAVPECLHATLEIECKFGTTNIMVFGKQFPKNNCTDRNVKLNWEIGYILAIVVCTVIVLLSVALSYMYITNKKGSSKTSAKKEELEEDSKFLP